MFKFPKLFKKKALPELSNGGIVVVENDSIRNDGYERLRDNILYLNADGKNKVIQVESSVAYEGKTTVLCNLAVSLGLTDKKVVVVDLDFRRPRTHRVFNLSKDVGVAEYILKGLETDKIIKQTKYKNVDLVTRGQEVYNSSLVFVSEKFKSLINELREKYDYVLLDCAPVLQVSDYIHISKLSDGVLFVVAHASTSRSQVSDAIKELRKNGANILGSVFSMYDSKRDKKYYTYSAYFEQ
jgi:capsular exopolysaccharide synthesis family protein